MHLSSSLALQLVGDRFALKPQGADYSFMVDLGDVPLEKLDGKLPAVVSPIQEFFLNYQPPKQLEALQIERRRFITGTERPELEITNIGSCVPFMVVEN